MKERKEINISIGERIRHSREASGYTQEKLAELIDVSTQYISDLERGVVGASIPTIIRICSFLAVSSDYILMGRNESIVPTSLIQKLQSMSPEELVLAEAAIKLVNEAFHLNTPKD